MVAGTGFVYEKVADCRRVRYEVEEMRRKKKRSKTNDEFVKDDESLQYDQIEKNNEVPKNEEEHVLRIRQSRQSLSMKTGLRTATPGRAMMILLLRNMNGSKPMTRVKKNPSLKEIIGQGTGAC